MSYSEQRTRLLQETEQRQEKGLEVLQFVVHGLPSLDAGQAQISEVIPPTMKCLRQDVHSHEHRLFVAHIHFDEVVGASNLR